MVGMRRTLGYHIVVSGYGLWLPGDERGHWSEAWDAELGFIEPHVLHEGDPVRQRMAEERRKHLPVRLDAAMQAVVAEAIARCRAESDWRIAAASIEATHTHLLMTYSDRDVDNTVKWRRFLLRRAHPATSGRGFMGFLNRGWGTVMPIAMVSARKVSDRRRQLFELLEEAVRDAEAGIWW